MLRSVLILAALVASLWVLPALGAPASVDGGPLGVELPPENGSAPPGSYAEAINAGRAAWMRNAPAEARDWFAEAWARAGEAGPAGARAAVLVAELERLAGNDEEMQRWIARADAIEPQDSDVTVALARVEILSGNRAAAQQRLEAAIERGGDETWKLQTALGEAFLAGRQPLRALTRYEAAIESAPGEVAPRLGAATALLQRERYPEAEGHFREALRLNPGDARAGHAYARFLVEQRRAEDALAVLDDVVKANPAYAAARMDRADLRVSLNYFDGALADYDQLLAANPDLAIIHFKKAVTQQRSGAIPAAIETYQRAVQLDPGMFGALNNLAWLEADRGGDLERALDWAEEAAALVPDNPAVLDTLAFVHQRRGEFSDALNASRRAVELAPQSADLRLRLGETLLASGDRESGRAELQRLVDEVPESAEAARAAELLAQ